MWVTSSWVGMNPYCRTLYVPDYPIIRMIIIDLDYRCMSPDNFTIPSSNRGSTLNCYRWLPDDGPVASLQIVHGMTEHILRYSGLAEYLNGLGIAVYGHDHLGHGGSSGTRGYFAEKDGDDNLVEDMGLMADVVERELPDIPHFVMGHSMGSFVTRRFMALHGDRIAGAVVMGTGNQSGGTISFALFMAKLLCAVKGGERTSGFLNNTVLGGYNKAFTEPDHPHRWLCSNIEALDAYRDDPQCGFDFTNAGYRDMFAMIGRLLRKEEFEDIPKDLPILFVSGSEDPVGDFGKGVERAVEDLKGMGLEPEVIMYPGMRHEILNEIGGERVSEDIGDWLLRNVKGC